MEIAISALAFFALIAFAVLAAYVIYTRAGKHEEQSDYARRRPLNSYEQAMYWRLVRTLPEHVVLAQVAMKRCIAARGPNAAIIARESLDFVVCNKAMRVIAAIEIEDENCPTSEYREKVSLVKEEALDAAGIRVIKCTAQALLSEAYISMEFDNHSSLMSRLAA